MRTVEDILLDARAERLAVHPRAIPIDTTGEPLPKVRAQRAAGIAPDVLRRAAKLRAEGLLLDVVAARLGFHPRSLRRAMRRAERREVAP